MAQDEDRNKAVLEEFDELLGSEELSRLDDLCTAGMVNHALAPGRPAGLAGTREFLETMGRHQMTSDGWLSLTVLAEGDRVVQFGVRGGEWHGGSFMGIECAPGHYERDFAAMYRFEEGRIAERWVVRDDLTMVRQLGGLTPRAG
jgi:predicted ester cyclase